MSGKSRQETLVFDDDTERKLAYASACVTVLGSALPWYTFFGTWILGIDTDSGIITLGLGLAVAAGIYLFEWDGRTTLVVAITGGLVLLVALAELRGISTIGVYVTMLGGVGLLVAGQSGYRRR